MEFDILFTLLYQPFSDTSYSIVFKLVVNILRCFIFLIRMLFGQKAAYNFAVSPFRFAVLNFMSVT